MANKKKGFRRGVWGRAIGHHSLTGGVVFKKKENSRKKAAAPKTDKDRRSDPYRVRGDVRA